MSYIGKSPIIGNFVKLDAITAVNGQAAYTMQNGGANFTDYESVNQFLVSLNGTIQAPTDSFTVSGSTLTFASNLATGDVIDFVMCFGNSLSAGVPTDATVSTAKIVDDAVTAAKINNDIISGSTELASEPADTDEFLVSDAGTLKRIDYSLIKGGGSWVKISTVTASSSATVDFDNVASTYKMYAIVGTGITPATDNVEFLCNFGSDGSTYASNKTSVYYHQYNRSASDDATGGVSAGGYSLENDTANQTIAYALDNTSNYGKTNTMFAYFGGLAQGGYSCYNIEFNMYGSNNYNYAQKVTGVVIGDVDCVRFLMSSGNIASGTFTLYGIDQS